MKCDKCGEGEMVVGQAIGTVEEYLCNCFSHYRTIDADNIKVINCYKCPLCGNSVSLDHYK